MSLDYTFYTPPLGKAAPTLPHNWENIEDDVELKL